MKNFCIKFNLFFSWPLHWSPSQLRERQSDLRGKAWTVCKNQQFSGRTCRNSTSWPKRKWKAANTTDRGEFHTSQECSTESSEGEAISSITRSSKENATGEESSRVMKMLKSNYLTKVKIAVWTWFDLPIWDFNISTRTSAWKDIRRLRAHSNGRNDQ